jgi:hypothetical protein
MPEDLVVAFALPALNGRLSVAQRRNRPFDRRLHIFHFSGTRLALDVFEARLRPSRAGDRARLGFADDALGFETGVGLDVVRAFAPSSSCSLGFSCTRCSFSTASTRRLLAGPVGFPQGCS